MKSALSVGCLVRTAIEAVLEYLVLKQLAGKSNVVKAIYSYFVEGASPSSIASELGMSKHQVRGYVQRIVEKAGSITRARAIVKYVVPHVMRIKPVIKPLDGTTARCSICGDEVFLVVAEEHVKRYHGALVNEYVASIIDIIRKEIVKARTEGYRVGEES